VSRRCPCSLPFTPVAIPPGSNYATTRDLARVQTINFAVRSAGCRRAEVNLADGLNAKTRHRIPTSRHHWPPGGRTGRSPGDLGCVCEPRSLPVLTIGVVSAAQISTNSTLPQSSQSRDSSRTRPEDKTKIANFRFAPWFEQTPGPSDPCTPAPAAPLQFVLPSSVTLPPGSESQAPTRWPAGVHFPITSSPGKRNRRTGYGSVKTVATEVANFPSNRLHFFRRTR
jgi:hypothetical protein